MELRFQGKQFMLLVSAIGGFIIIGVIVFYAVYSLGTPKQKTVKKVPSVQTSNGLE